MEGLLRNLGKKRRAVVVATFVVAALVVSVSEPVKAQPFTDQSATAQPVEDRPILQGSHLLANSAHESLASAWAELNRWLGPGANGAMWRRYLHAHDLDAQLARGDDADAAVLQRLLDRFGGDANGLDKRRFVAVRDALRRRIGELKQMLRHDLAALTRASRADHDPVRPAELASLQRRLRACAARLQQTLGAGAKLAEGWNAYLRWDLLEPHLQSDAVPTGASLANLELVARRFRTNAPGLENDLFMETADALDAYRELAPWALAAEEGDPRLAYERNMRNLAIQIERHAEHPTSETSWKIGRVIGLVDRLDDSPLLVAETRRRYARPNLYASVSTTMLNRLGRRPVDTTRPVRDLILGTRIRGTARTLGQVTYRTLPSDGRIQLEVLLDGNAYSQTVGYNGPARIRSVGVTSLSASSRLYFSDALFEMGRAVAQARTNSRICSLEKRGGRLGHRLVERIGRKRAAQQKGQAEQIAGRHASDQAAANFDEQLRQALFAGRERYERSIQAPLRRRNFLPGELHFSSTSAEMRVHGAFAQTHQLAAGAVAPPSSWASPDVTLQIHESVVNNYLPLVLGGVTLAQDEVDQPLRLEGDAPAWLRKGAQQAPRPRGAAQTSNRGAGPLLVEPQNAGDEPASNRPPFRPWSMTLNRDAPVSVTFAKGLATLRVRAAVLKSEDAEYANWDFIVAYRIERQTSGILLRREGDIEVFPTGFDPQWDKTMSSQKSGFRSTLSKNMNARAEAGEGFPAEIKLDKLAIPGITDVELSSLTCDGGWLALEWVIR